jgi:hypothetical protein
VGLLGASLPGDLWLCLDQDYGESTQGSDPRRGKDARLARKESRFGCETGGLARKGFGVARKAEEACA